MSHSNALRMLAAAFVLGAAGMAWGQSPKPALSPGQAVAEAKAVVDLAVRCGGEPRVDAGPPAVPGKNIALVIEDLRNGGVLAASLGLREACLLYTYPSPRD